MNPLLESDGLTIGHRAERLTLWQVCQGWTVRHVRFTVDLIVVCIIAGAFLEALELLVLWHG